MGIGGIEWHLLWAREEEEIEAQRICTFVTDNALTWLAHIGYHVPAFQSLAEGDFGARHADSAVLTPAADATSLGGQAIPPAA